MFQYQVKELAKELFSQYGLDKDGWKLDFDNAIRRNGCCSYSTKTISLSRHYIKLNTPELVKDTLLHEIAHALTPDDRGHGRSWKLKCAEIGAMPVAVKRSMGIKQVEGKWKAECPNPDCDFKVTRHRKPTSRHRYSCNKCSGRFFNWRYELIFKKEEA